MPRWPWLAIRRTSRRVAQDPFRFSFASCAASGFEAAASHCLPNSRGIEAPGRGAHHACLSDDPRR